MTSTILVLGNANVDLTSYVNSMPEDGETVIGHDFSIGMGGKGSNQAVACSRSGAPTAFVGSIGMDTFGDFAFDTLSAEQLDLSHLRRVDAPTGVASITVDNTGANRIAVYLGASGDLGEDAIAGALTSMPSLRFFVSQLELPGPTVSHALNQAKRADLTTVVNIAPYRPLSVDDLAHTDWLIGNEGETTSLLVDRGLEADLPDDPQALAKRIDTWATHLGVNLVVTLGEKGAVGYHPDTGAYIAEAPRVSAVDTVGAGDCFVGFFVGLLDAGHPWQGALTAAVVAASDSVQQRGAQSSYPSPDEADRFHTIAGTTLA